MTDEEGSGVFLPPLFPTSECTPSYSSTIVHMARSPPTPHPRPPYSALGPVHVAAHSSPTVCSTLVGLAQVWKGAGAAASYTGCTLRSDGPRGCFMLILFPSSIRETPRHLAHIWSCLMRGRVCLSHYCERSNLEPSGDSGCLARAEPRRRVNDNSFCQELRGNI